MNLQDIECNVIAINAKMRTVTVQRDNTMLSVNVYCNDSDTDVTDRALHQLISIVAQEAA